MQLGRSGASNAPSPPTVPAALAVTAQKMGHRPAITMLGAGPGRDRRDEQAYASVQQWVAKGAHLLQVDLGIGPGDLLLVDSPGHWMAATVCLAAWWTGAAVTDDPSLAEYGVVHESRATENRKGCWVIGDAIDGTPSIALPGFVAWAVDVQAFPDQPPMPAARAEHAAVVTSESNWSQMDLVARALESHPGVGRVGLRNPVDLASLAVTLAARPAVTGASTVLVEHADDDQIDAERVRAWA